jgi:polyisoprenyl-teichoic acid--peptidoglycan teichoic acid transferase
VLLPSSALSFLRRFAIALLAVVVVATVGFVSAQAYGKREFAKSRTITIPNGILAQVKPGEPANYLLIGSDIRSADETPQEAQAYGSSKELGTAGRSDVMMVLHVDPASHTGLLVSFPRDLIVDIPGHGRNLLNASFAFGGPSLVIETLQKEFTPLKINHYLEVDFRGFKDIVNKIGHIKVWFPTAVHDPFTGLDVEQPGCVSLDGDQALAYSRSRHYNIPEDKQNPAPWRPTGSEMTSRGWIEDPLSDLDRIPRQQYFLRTVSQAATDKTGSDPLKINGLLNAVFRSLGHDQTLKYEELTSLAVTFKGLNPARVQMMTLPVAKSPYRQFPGQVVAKFPDAGGVIGLLSTFTAPRRVLVKPLAANKVKVRVVNGSGVKGAATKVLDTFTAAGFKSGGDAVDADRSDYKTQIRYAPGKFNQGYTIATAVGTANLVPAASQKSTLGGDALLIVGTDYDSLAHHFELIPRPAGVTIPPSTTTSSGVPATTTTTTVAKTADNPFVPVDPKTGGALVGCPAK